MTDINTEKALAVTQARNALGRTITKLKRQNEAVEATKAELGLWESRIAELEGKKVK